jgi:hypothetical protein
MHSRSRRIELVETEQSRAEQVKWSAEMEIEMEGSNSGEDSKLNEHSRCSQLCIPWMR